METTLQPKKRSRIYGVLVTLAWMLLAFVAGTFVGIHPEWIPNMPWAWHPSNEDAPPAQLNVPTSQPIADNSAPAQQTQSLPAGQ